MPSPPPSVSEGPSPDAKRLPFVPESPDTATKRARLNWADKDTTDGESSPFYIGCSVMEELLGTTNFSLDNVTEPEKLAPPRSPTTPQVSNDAVEGGAASAASGGGTATPIGGEPLDVDETAPGQTPNEAPNEAPKETPKEAAEGAGAKK